MGDTVREGGTLLWESEAVKREATGDTVDEKRAYSVSHCRRLEKQWMEVYEDI